ncbi:MAG TPA: hypothetical protein VK168_12055 [Saprospiraceae bacterium]|nr:hypothetical protein [Saprospiraceae bacterium]
MKFRYLIFVSISLFAACIVPESRPSKSLPKQTFFRQLYHHFETLDSDFCTKSNPLEGAQMGAICFTEKGNVIFNVLRDDRDTVSYLFGTYAFTDAGMVCTLTDEFYYPGRWDASWIGPDPDYTKGKTRKITPLRMALQSVPCAEIPYAHVYTEAEKHVAGKRLNGSLPYGFYLEPYEEPADMKYYSWFYQQVPVLAQL